MDGAAGAHGEAASSGDEQRRETPRNLVATLLAIWFKISTALTRVQSDILNRIQESHGRLDVEIRKLLHEVSRVAEQALSNARRVREEGAWEVEAALERLGTLEREIVNLGDVAFLSSPTKR